MRDIAVWSRHCPPDKLAKKFPGYLVLDLTSRGEQPWVRFSPFYPLGGIPVPNFPQHLSQSVEGVWQGLKVFENHGVDLSKFEVTSMKGLKRTVRKFGRCRGHSTDGSGLLGYLDARLQIYLPTYRWALENRLQEEVEALRELAEKSPLLLLDYETNPDVCNLKKPLSHAALVARFLREEWPEKDVRLGSDQSSSRQYRK